MAAMLVIALAATGGPMSGRTDLGIPGSHTSKQPRNAKAHAQTFPPDCDHCRYNRPGRALGRPLPAAAGSA